jgi:hypothetical protein
LTRLAVAGIALIATVSAASGWFLGSKRPFSHPVPNTASTNVLTPPAADRVRVFSDGTVSIQVTKAPLRWLWDELARQGGGLRGEATEPEAPRTAVVPAATPSEPASDTSTQSEQQRDSAAVLRTLREGNAAERLAALQQADSVGAVLPAELLQQFIDSDPSDQVRLQAFKIYVDLRSNDADAVAKALEAGRYNQSAQVRAESNKRLEMFDQRLHVQTAEVQP